MKLIFSPPSIEDLIRLLKAWKFWILAASIGALIGAAIYYIMPSPYRARATVLVDFNPEQDWPKDTDRQQFYYLERKSCNWKRLPGLILICRLWYKTMPSLLLS